MRKLVAALAFACATTLPATAQTVQERLPTCFGVVFIGDDFCRLAGFRKQKFRDFQRRFAPRFGICSGILDNAKQGVERLRTPVSDGGNHCGHLRAFRRRRRALCGEHGAWSRRQIASERASSFLIFSAMAGILAVGSFMPCNMLSRASTENLTSLAAILVSPQFLEFRLRGANGSRE